ncbi:hypothetical protein IEO21_06898 [Rhodonia placenta]|uniref:VWFA domain-containing protein n=1 Tax=Rhodonia placenta TaxID=104341 RepID=A0A8H7NZ74_9APHY|nr:hypothetical protein IEO21_06898 [Postia placenta]
MAESHSVHLAYETLALVSKALSRLEVGDVAIAKFGESVDVLHGFDSEPFTDQTGMRIMSAFQFDQKATQIIISDGMCQDHEKLRTVLRKAEEERVMVVFIILDSLHARSSSDSGNANQNSILSMNQVAYKNIDGRLDLHVERYLDSFPFEYYVVLRDVEALPEVLSGTLKQFFERVTEQ